MRRLCKSLLNWSDHSDKDHISWMISATRIFSPSDNNALDFLRLNTRFLSFKISYISCLINSLLKRISIILIWSSRRSATLREVIWLHASMLSKLDSHEALFLGKNLPNKINEFKKYVWEFYKNKKLFQHLFYKLLILFPSFLYLDSHSKKNLLTKHLF